MGFTPLGNSTRSQTSLYLIELISSSMALIHFWELELFMAWQKLIGSSFINLMSSSCSWRYTRYSSKITLLLSLVNLLSDTSWGCWVCPIDCIWGGFSLWYYFINVSWITIGMNTWSLSIIDFSSKTTFLMFPSPPNSTSSRNITFPVSKINLDVGS